MKKDHIRDYATEAFRYYARIGKTAEEVRTYSGGKDIARMNLPEGGTVYKVGPYTDKDKADQLVTFIRDMGVADVACKVLGE